MIVINALFSKSLPENHDIPSSSTKARTSRNTKRKSIIFNLPDEDDSIYEIRNSQYKSSPISKFHKAEALLHQSPGPQQELTEQELASRFMSSPVITHRGPARSVLTPIVPLSNSSPQIQMFDQAHSSDSLLLKAPSLKTSCEVSKDCLLQLLKSDRMESDDFGDHEMIVESQDFFQPSVTSTENALIKKADPISLKKSSQQGSLIIHTDPFDFSTQADMDLAQIDFDAFIPPMNVVKSNTPAQQPTTHHHQSVSHNNHPSQLSNSAQDTPFAKPARRKRLIVTDASSSTSRPQDVDLFQQESPLAKEIESGITRDTQGRVFVPKRTPLLERLEKRKQMRRPAPKMRCTPVVVPRRQLNTKKTEEGSKDKTRIKKKVTVNPFMELDAEWSRSEDGSSVSSDTDDDGLDANLTGFIVDSFTQEEHAPEASCIGMTQVYRTSLLSPEVGGWVTGKKARPGAYQFRAPQKDRYPVQDTQFSGAPIPDSDTPGSLADFIVEEEDTMLDVVLEEEEEELEDEAEAGISAESTRPTTGSLLQLHDLLDVSDSE